MLVNSGAITIAKKLKEIKKKYGNELKTDELDPLLLDEMDAKSLLFPLK